MVPSQKIAEKASEKLIQPRKQLKMQITRTEKFVPFKDAAKEGIEESSSEVMKNAIQPRKIKNIKSKGSDKKFPDLTGDGQVTKADILKGRGVLGKSNRPQTGEINFKK